MCNQSEDASLGKENAGQTANCNQLLRQPVCRKDLMSFPTNHNFQLVCESRGEEVRGVGAFYNDDAWKRANNGSCEEDRMEFDGGGEASASLQ